MVVKEKKKINKKKERERERGRGYVVANEDMSGDNVRELSSNSV